MAIQDCYILRIKNIPTTNQYKMPNGGLLPLLNIYEDDTEPIEQVYITICEEGYVKGPHCHYPPKTDRFYCIEGRCVLVCRNEETQEYKEFELQQFDSQLLIIPPGNSHAIVARGSRATILSMPTEGYNPKQEYNQYETEYVGYNWSRWK